MTSRIAFLIHSISLCIGFGLFSVTRGADVPTPAKVDPGTVILKEDWAKADSGVPWVTARPPTDTVDGIHVAKLVTAAAGGNNIAFFVFDPAVVGGKWLTIKTRVKGINISAPPNDYNGVKISIHTKAADGTDNYPQSDALPSGNFDWKDVEWRVQIPNNTASAEFGIGLENVQGTVLFAPITITVTNS